MADAPSDIGTRERPETAPADADLAHRIEGVLQEPAAQQADHLIAPEPAIEATEHDDPQPGSPPQFEADAGEAMPPEMAGVADLPEEPTAEPDYEIALDAEPGFEPEPEPELEPLPAEDDAPDGVISTLAHTEEVPTVAASLAPPVIVAGRYEVHPSRPIPDLDSPSARAFEAVDRENPRIEYFALIPIPGMPVRKREIDEMVGHLIPNILPLTETGTAEWPIHERECLFLIFERPLGGRVLRALRSDMPDYKKIDILRAVVDGISNGLQQLQFRGILHHAIRPDNLFFMDEAMTQIVLGEFLSSPPSFDQPIAFETIERSMAIESGRGVGFLSDDLYSFGATLAFLLQRNSPVRGMTKEQVIVAKIMNSSYQSLVGRHLLTPRFLELMRGLLHDDPAQRWDFESIEQWSHGRRVAPTQSSPQLRSQRPFRFGNIDHIQPRSLAYIMSQRRETAIKLIRDGTLETWILRGLEDKDLAASVQGRVDYIDSQKDLSDPDDILLTRVLLVLDPSAPLNYKNFTFFPESFGTLLAVEMMREGDIRTLAEMVVRDIPRIWFEAQPGGIGQNFIEETAFQRLRLYLQKTTPGYGLERCLYEANPSVPCKSPLMDTRYVVEIEKLLLVLNDAERRVDSKAKPLDRHLAAFIAARAGADTETFIDDFGDRDEAISAMAILRLYSRLQEKFGPEILLGLTRWIGGQVGPVIRLFHSRATRRDLEAEIPQIVRRGSLPELLAVLDDAEIKAKDRNGFTAAVAEFQKAESEVIEITTNSRPGSAKVQRTSYQVAAILSVMLMICIVSLIIMAH